MISESAIYNFLINNKKLETLEEQLKEFNPFRILKIAHHELKHSNILAWLIDPKGNHNLGSTILKKIILDILMDPDNEGKIHSKILIKDVYDSDFSDSIIFRERKIFRGREKIDIFVISESNHFILYFENKVYANQSKAQLELYYNSVITEFPRSKFKILPVLLTIEGETPLHKQYCKYKHSNIHNIISESLKLYKSRMSEEVAQFIVYYLETLKGILMIDKKIEKLCQDIYYEHKDVIELIYEIGNKVDISKSIAEFKKTVPHIVETKNINREYWFNLPEFRLDPKPGVEGWGDGIPFSFWFEIQTKERKLKLLLEIGIFNNPDQRHNFMLHLEKEGMKISDRAKEAGRSYSRICTDTVAIKDWSDADEISDAMIKLYNTKKMTQTSSLLITAIKSFKWK